MKYELRENQGIPAPLLALMAVATGLSVACHSTLPEHLLGVGRIFACRDIFGHAAVLHSVGVV